MFMSRQNNDSVHLLDVRPDAATAGPILVQGFLQYLFQGVIVTQALKFYDRCENDTLALRVYVLILLCFSILQTVLESYKVWDESIVGRHWYMSHLHFTEFLCNALICSLCEVFLIRRCYRITGRKKWVLILLLALAFATITATVILTVKIAMVMGPISDSRHVDPLHASAFAYPLWVYGTLLMALSLTTILSLSLRRTKTGLADLDRTLNHIITITWETAALPAIFMLASAIIYSIRDADSTASVTNSGSTFTELNLDLFFAILTGKVYTLGLLRTLNKRTEFRNDLQAVSNLGRRSLSGYQWSGSGGADHASGGNGRGTGSSGLVFEGGGDREGSANGVGRVSCPDSVRTGSDASDASTRVASGEDTGRRKSSVMFATPLLSEVQRPAGVDDGPLEAHPERGPDEKDVPVVERDVSSPSPSLTEEEHSVPPMQIP